MITSRSVEDPVAVAAAAAVAVAAAVAGVVADSGWWEG